MNNPRVGTIAFLFTDIEGSTHLWEQHPDAMRSTLARHDEILHLAIITNNGHIFKTIGDAFCAAFPTALDALNAAIATQRAIQDEDWRDVGSLRVRAGIHSGVAQERDGDYFGQPLNRVARLMAAGHGGQTLLSQSAYEWIRDYLPTGIELRDMGERRLRDLTQPEHIYQVLAAGLPTEFPPLRTLDYRPNNLPRHTTSIVGREKEITGLVALVRRPQVALVTLTGPGGTGKTRLALQVAAESLDYFPDGVWFVDLAPITDTHLVMPTIAHVLSLKEGADQSIVDVLKNYLRDRQLLLVLDNFEQVIDASRDIAQLLSVSPKLKIIATSRIPLRVRGEKEYPVSPLQLPDLKHLPSPDQLSQNASVRLFVERATDVKPDFRLNKENARPVAEICTRLDGLPLAIELAAARVRLLSPDMMLSRLQNRLKLLTGGARDLPARQQTIFNTIDWSYDLLDEGEKQFFRRIAVFQGGRTLEAMEAVCDFDGKLQMDVLDAVESLVSKNLLQQREGAEGEPRFWTLETIHEYARDRLHSSLDEEQEIERHHAIYFMRMTEKAWPNLAAPLEARWIARLEVDYDNIRAALRWARERDELEIGLRIVGALIKFWEVHGYVTEGWEQASELLTLDSKGQSAKMVASPTIAEGRAKAQAGAGLMMFYKGDYPTARLLLDQGLSTHRELGDQIGTAICLRWLSMVVGAQDDTILAYSLLEQSLALFREISHTLGIGIVLQGIGNWNSIQGNYAEARLRHEESLTLFRESGDGWNVYITMFNLAQVARMEGDNERALELYKLSLSMSPELGDKRLIASLLMGFGGLAGATKQPVRSARILGASEALHEALGLAMEPEDKILFDRDVASIRHQLSDDDLTKVWAEGRAMSMDEALAYALEDETTTNPE